MGRDYLAKVFKGLAQNEVIKEGMLRWDPKKKEHYAQLYTAVAGIFVLILKTNGAYHTGQVFDGRIFDTLRPFSDEEAAKPFDELPRERQVEILLQLQPEHEFREDSESKVKEPSFTKNLLSLLQGKNLDPKVIEQMFFITDGFVPEEYCEGGKLSPKKVADDLKAIKENFFTEFKASFEGKVRFLHTTANLFHENGLWETVKGIDGPTLSLIIQGEFSREGLNNKLQFGSSVSPELQSSIRNWVNTAEEQTLKNFLSHVTGAPVLPNNPINFNCFNNVKTPTAQSCFYSVALPVETTPDGLTSYLQSFEKSLQEGFDVE